MRKVHNNIMNALYFAVGISILSFTLEPAENYRAKQIERHLEMRNQKPFAIFQRYDVNKDGILQTNEFTRLSRDYSFQRKRRK